MAVWSIVNFSDITEDHRIDAEHYRPECLAQAKLIAAMPNAPLSSLADVSDGNHLSIAESFSETGIRYLRGQDLSDFFIAEKSPVHVPESVYATLQRSHILPGDVLLGIVATIGTVSFVTDRFGKLTGNCKIAILRPRGVEGELLAAFFLSELGQREIHRWARGTVQTGVILPDLKKLPIPIIANGPRRRIVELVRAAHDNRQASAKHYADAETLLTASLGLDRMDLAPYLFYEDTFSHTAAAGRFDPEYYQPAKWNVLRALAAMPGKPLAEHFRAVKKLWQPNEQPSTATVRNYDLTDALTPFLDDTTPTATAGEIKSTKKRFEPGDLVVSRLHSYLKEIAVVFPSTGAPLVGSTEFIVLRSRKTGLSAESLLVFLRSAPVQTILKWCQDGSNHPRFAEKELLRLPVPDAVVKVQGAICEKIREAITARQESRRLLDEAKRTVEAAILEGS